MSLEYTEQNKLFIKKIMSLAESSLNLHTTSRDKEEFFNKEIWADCGTLGIQGLVVPEEFGGQGYSIRSTIIALESLGYACQDNGLSFAIGAHLLAGVIPIWLYGSAEQKEQLLPDLCNGKKIIANAISEAKSGSDVFSMQSEAIRKKEGYFLKGEKNYCSNAPVADMVLTYVLTDKKKGMLGGVSAFLLDKEKGDFKTSEKISKMGLRSCLMGTIYFQEKEISSSQLLGKEGGGAMIFNKSMIWERIGLSAIHIGTMTRLIEEAIQFVKKRKVYGHPISKYQAIAHKLVELKVELEAAKQLVYLAASKLSAKKPADMAASMAKLKTTELYKRGTMDLLQIYGAAAYIENSAIERTLRDAVASTLYSGSSEIQKNIIAGRLGL